MTNAAIEKPHTQLSILPDGIELSIEPGINLAYKYLTSYESCESFMNGSIWFAGTNMNRYYHGDPTEHYYLRHSKVLSSALSLSLLHPSKMEADYLKEKPFHIK